jgi:predicted PurR-regulated permease PerM
VTRATLKGVLLIATIQGTINGFAFWLVGIDGAVFWGVLMIVLSIIPVVGGAIVWVPAAGYLLLTGQFAKAGVLFVVCGLLAGSIDNVLRPRLVGRDTQMHDLLIFCSTLGGLDVFGPQGFIVGPILAALFLTVWDIFAVAFRTPPGVSASVGGAPGTQAPGA